MKRIALSFFLLASSGWAQHVILNVIPDPLQTTVGQINFWNQHQSFYLGMMAPASLGATGNWTLPPVGSAGCWGDTTGAGTLSLVACSGSLAPPVTLSATSSGNIFTVTQSGSGNAIVVTAGPSSMASSSSLATLTLTQSGSGDVLDLTGKESITGGLSVSGTASIANMTFGSFGAFVPTTAGGTNLGSGSLPFSYLYANNIQLSTSGTLTWGPSLGASLNSSGGATFLSTIAGGSWSLTNAGALTVASCSGCGGGVTSFNTRAGAVTLAKADVTAVDQALGTGDSPTFAGMTFGAFGAFVPVSAGGTNFGSSSLPFGTLYTNNIQLSTSGTVIWGPSLGASLNSGGGATFLNTIAGGSWSLTNAGALTVASCSGCGGGVTSFNGRAGAVSFVKADVTAVDQALGTGDSPTFAGMTFGAFGAFVPASAGGTNFGSSSLPFATLYTNNLQLSTSGTVIWGPGLGASLNSAGGATFLSSVSGTTFQASSDFRFSGWVVIDAATKHLAVQTAAFGNLSSGPSSGFSARGTLCIDSGNNMYYSTGAC